MRFGNRWLLGLIFMLLSGALCAAATGNGIERNAKVVETSAQKIDKRVALIIGNSAYKNTHPLANPANDAEDIANALQGFGFEVIKLKNGTRRQMNEKLAEFSNKIDGAAAALVYYAGHGAQIRGENYLMPVDVSVDTEAAIKDESVSLNRVLDELEGGRNRINIVMLDACRDNPVTGKFRSTQRGLAAPTSTPKGTVIVYATDPGNTAADGDGRNGTFTAGLLKAFKGQDLSLDGVLTVASAEVERTTNNRQTPYVNGPKTVQKQFQFAVTVNPGPQQIDGEFWASIKDSRDAADFEAYLEQFPKGNFRKLAENRLKTLRGTASVAAPVPQAAATPSPAPTTAAPPVPPKPSITPTLAPPVQQAASGYAPLSVFRDKLNDGSIGPDMVVIPAGNFDIGSPKTDKERGADEGPVKRITLKAFAIGKTEVTQQQWRQVMGSDPPALAFKGCDNCPVARVSWIDVQTYIAELNRKTGQRYRLPSEAEWEYACRGGKSGKKYCGGNEIDTLGWYQQNSGGTTQPVAQKKANGFGLYDMSGNVWEWVEDIYHNSYEGIAQDGSAWVTDKNDKRLVRGGSWENSPRYLRSAYRSSNTTENRHNIYGFRLARTLP